MKTYSITREIRLGQGQYAHETKQVKAESVRDAIRQLKWNASAVTQTGVVSPEAK